MDRYAERRTRAAVARLAEHRAAPVRSFEAISKQRIAHSKFMAERAALITADPAPIALRRIGRQRISPNPVASRIVVWASGNPAGIEIELLEHRTVGTQYPKVADLPAPLITVISGKANLLARQESSLEIGRVGSCWTVWKGRGEVVRG